MTGLAGFGGALVGVLLPPADGAGDIAGPAAGGSVGGAGPIAGGIAIMVIVLGHCGPQERCRRQSVAGMYGRLRLEMCEHAGRAGLVTGEVDAWSDRRWPQRAHCERKSDWLCLDVVCRRVFGGGVEKRERIRIE